MSDALDPLDPLLPAFALQHDLRERFLHALEEIVAVEPDQRHYRDAFQRCQIIAREALDEDSITEWEHAHRPLPWLDAVIGEQAAAVTEAVRASLEL